MSWEVIIQESEEGVSDVGFYALAKRKVKPDDVSDDLECMITIQLTQTLA